MLFKSPPGDVKTHSSRGVVDATPATVMRAFALLQLCVEAAVQEPGGEGSIHERRK